MTNILAIGSVDTSSVPIFFDWRVHLFKRRLTIGRSRIIFLYQIWYTNTERVFWGGFARCPVFFSHKWYVPSAHRMMTVFIYIEWFCYWMYARCISGLRLLLLCGVRSSASCYRNVEGLYSWTSLSIYIIIYTHDNLSW